MQKPVVFGVVGPTAVGKTAMGIRLAQMLGCEIISADARQFYQKMAIGTAQPSAAERAQVHHHFVDFLSPTDLFSAGAFAHQAREKLAAMFGGGRNSAVVVGGSGLYVQALIEGLNDLPADLKIRTELNARLEREGLPALFAELKALDPNHADRMDRHNPQRVVRALEVCLASGQPFSHFHQPGKRIEPPFEAVWLGLEAPRDVLDMRIRSRLHQMLAAGWEEEARHLLAYREENALQTVGYREWFAHFDGDLTRSEMLEQIAIRTRQFAKRQMTWFRRNEAIQWHSHEDVKGLLEKAAEICEARNIPLAQPVSHS